MINHVKQIQFDINGMTYALKRLSEIAKCASEIYKCFIEIQYIRKKKVITKKQFYKLVKQITK